MASRTYKAKRKNWRELPKKNQWVYGAIFEGKENSYIITNVKVTDEWEDSEIGADVIGYLVDPETICQDTGLTDKNGRKIFEGDIVRDFLCIDDHNEPLYEYGKVVYIHERISFEILDNDNNQITRIAELEVIGNIFDNPELIGEQP